MSGWIEWEARRINKTLVLLRPAIEEIGGVWADLGCGNRVFIYLLSTELQPGSFIYAVDRDPRALQAVTRHLAESNSAVTVQPVLADFTRPLSLPPLDGLLALLKPGGNLVVIEYHTRRVSSAVPYPLNETEFLALAAAIGLREARIVIRAPSMFLGEMYTGLGLAPSSGEAG